MTVPHRVLFVCLGNICRSPLAEGVFGALAAARGVADRFVVDSCGTGSWHVGNPPDPRTVDVARANGVTLTHRARVLRPADYADFDLLVAMDRANLATILSRGGPEDRTTLLRSFERGRIEHAGEPHPRHLGPELDVPDPYHGGPEGFEEVHRIVRSGCEGLLDTLLARAAR